MQPYRSIQELKLTHRIILPSPQQWYLLSDTDCKVGEINGVHTIRGQAVASNGIYVAVLTSSGQLDIGHKQWFCPDKSEENLGLTSIPKRIKVQKKLELAAKEEYF